MIERKFFLKYSIHLFQLMIKCEDYIYNTNAHIYTHSEKKNRIGFLSPSFFNFDHCQFGKKLFTIWFLHSYCCHFNLSNLSSFVKIYTTKKIHWIDKRWLACFVVWDLVFRTNIRCDAMRLSKSRCFILPPDGMLYSVNFIFNVNHIDPSHNQLNICVKMSWHDADCYGVTSSSSYTFLINFYRQSMHERTNERTSELMNEN